MTWNAAVRYDEDEGIYRVFTAKELKKVNDKGNRSENKKGVNLTMPNKPKKHQVKAV